MAESSPLKIEFTYDPSNVSFRYIQAPVSAELYKKLFELSGGSIDDVVFESFNEAVINHDPIIFLETVCELSKINMVIHDRDMFLFQLIEQKDGKVECPEDVESIVNALLYQTTAGEGKCHGLRPPKDQDIRLKKNLPGICKRLGIPTLKVINGSSLIEGAKEYRDTLKKLQSWGGGFYLKNSASSNGRGMIIYTPKNKEELKGYVQAVLDTLNLNENKDNLIITQRVDTPHPRYASHYGVFTFYDGKKAHILSGVLCYNPENRFTVHGNSTKKIPLTGDYVEKRMSSEERKVLEAHGLKYNELPEKVRDISLKVCAYAGGKGRLFLCSEIIEDTAGNLYLMDVNGVPGFGAVKTTEFAPGSNPKFEDICRKTAEMILGCYK